MVWEGHSGKRKRQGRAITSDQQIEDFFYGLCTRSILLKDLLFSMGQLKSLLWWGGISVVAFKHWTWDIGEWGDGAEREGGKENPSQIPC